MFRSFLRRGPKSTKTRLTLECLESRDAPAVLNSPVLIANGVIDRPESAANASGAHVVVWTQRNGVLDTDIYAQRFNALGDKIGAAIRVTTSGDNESEPDVCVDASGNFTVSYTRASGFSTHIEIARFNANGVFLERVFVPSASTFFNEKDSHLACSAAGRVVVSYTQASNFGEQDVLARTYGLVNNRLTQTRLIQVAALPGVAEADSDVARIALSTPLGATNFAVVYVVNGDVLARRYDDNGNLLNALNPVIRVADRAFAENDPSIAVNAGGTFAVAWQQQPSFFAGHDIAARTFNVNGVLSPSIRNVQTSPLDDTAPEVAIRNDGSYLVSYRSEQTGLFTFQVNVSNVPTSATLSVQTQLVTMQSFVGQAVGFSTLSMDPTVDPLHPTTIHYFIAYTQPSAVAFGASLVGQQR